MSRLIGCLFIVVSLFQQPLFAQPAFGTKTNHTGASLSQPYYVALGDLNGDGKLDMVSGNSTNTISVFLNTTLPDADTISFTPYTDFTTGGGSHSVAITDINGDGKLDIVCGNIYSQNFSVLMNKTTPGSLTPAFSTSTNTAAASYAQSLASADFNGDGRTDVIMVAGHISLFLNTTPFSDTVATFSSEQTFEAGSGSSQLSVGDVNGDGKPDIAVSNTGNASKNVTILLNTTSDGSATASFASPTDIVINGSYLPEGVALGDLNGDNMPDLAVTLYARDTLIVYFNTTSLGSSSPSFSGWTAFDTHDGPMSIIIDDVNADNINDIITTDRNAFGVSVFLNLTPPGSSTPVLDSGYVFVFSNTPHHSALGDLNGDGLPDLAVPSFNITDYVAVRCNTTPVGVASPTFSGATSDSIPNITSYQLGDLNGDGAIDFAMTSLHSGDLVGKVSVKLNTTAVAASTTTFTALTQFLVGDNPEFNSIYSSSIEIADIDGDGKRDLLVTQAHSADDSLSIFLNTMALGASTPSFGPRLAYSVGPYPGSIGTCDINNDGRLDVVFVGEFTVAVLLNTTAWGTGTPTFASRVEFTVADYPNSFLFGDINGDGLKDIAALSYLSQSISILLNSTTPGSSVPSFLSYYEVATGLGPWDALLVDMNRDGKLDIVVALYDGNGVEIHPNTTTPGASTPSFSSAILIVSDEELPDAIHSIATADLNEDGKIDLVVTPDGSPVSYFQNSTAAGTSTPTFDPMISLPTSNFPTFILSVADMNRDGRPDLVTANPNSTLGVHLNGNDITLPVTMTGLTAQASASGAILSWRTATEADNAGWFVERRKISAQSGVQSTEKAVGEWRSVGFVEGAGTSSSRREYSFSDNSIIETRKLTIDNRFAYRLKQVDRTGAFSYSGEVEVEIGAAPRVFSLSQNYPNPFNPTTTIEFTVPQDGQATLKILNILGQEVLTGFHGEAKAGRFHTVDIDGSGLASGLYFSLLESGGKQLVRKMMLLK